MKKLFYILSFWIAFFIGGLFYSLTVKASAAPSINSGVFNVMTNTAEQMLDLGYVPQSLSPYSPISTSNWTPWQAGAALLSFDINDCVTTELTQQQKDELFNSYTIVDTSNVEISVSSPIYCVTMDNGYFSGCCYVDDQGKLLSYSNDLGGQLLQIKFGGSVKSSEDWQTLYENTATQIYQSNLTLYNDPSLIQDCSYYGFCGKRYNAMGVIYEFANYLFIANQYQPGVIMPVPGSNNFINTWYFNSYDAFEYKIVFGSYNNGYTVTDGTYNLNGVTYNHQLRFQMFNPTTTVNMTYSEWLNNGQMPSHGYFAMSGMFYNSNIDTSEDPVTFKPLETSNDQQIINYNYYYSPTDISSLSQQISDLQSQINNLYNSSNSISSQNYPIYYPATTVQNQPSEIPFPNIQNYPSYVNPLDPAPVPMPDPATAPSIGSDLGEVDPSDLRSGIPIINNLLNRFPFSIPWDIYDLLNGFSVPREVPYIDTYFTFPVVNYTWHIQYDLSAFADTAALFRVLFLISFIIGLAYFSYDHFFGS